MNTKKSLSPLFARLLLTALGAVISTTTVQASEAIIKKARCIACHSAEEKRVGPAYKDVAAKYAKDASAEERLINKIRHGGSGAWGDIPMPENTVKTISDADLKLAVQWILALKK